MKQNYLTPRADVLPVKMEGVICGSQDGSKVYKANPTMEVGGNGVADEF